MRVHRGAGCGRSARAGSASRSCWAMSCRVIRPGAVCSATLRSIGRLRQASSLPIIRGLVHVITAFMTLFARILPAALFVLAGACGGSSSSGGGALTGTVHGQSIMIEDAISVAATLSGGTPQLHGAAIALSTTKDLCADAMSNAQHPNEKAVAIVLFDVNGTSTSTPTAPGTYTIFSGSGTPPAKSASLSVAVTDAMCHDVAAQDASGVTGTVTLSSVSGNQFSGSFDVVLDSGDHVTGSFDPQACPALATALNNSSPSSCM